MKAGSVAGPAQTLAAVDVDQAALGPLTFTPKTKLSPIGHAIQHALFRRDRDGRTRLEKLGEMVVKKALDGDKDFVAIAFDRFVGKVVPMAEDGSNKEELQPVLLQALVTALIEKKLAPVLVGSARVTDVIEQAIKDKE